jgi:hypothetical protein
MYDDHIYRAYEVRMFLWRQIWHPMNYLM